MKKYFQAPWSIKDVFEIITIIVFLFILLSAVLSSSTIEQKLANSDLTSLYIAIGVFIQGSLALSVLYFVSKKRYKKLNYSDLGFKKIGVLKTLFAIISAYLVYIGVTLVISIIIFYFNIQIPGYEMQEDILGLFGTTNLDLIIAGIAIVIIAPIFEEIFFRGFVLRSFSNHLGIFKGSIISALFFSLLHYPWQSFIPIFILGLIINSIVIRYKSIWPAIGFHMFNNGLVFTIQILILKEYISLDKIIN